MSSSQIFMTQLNFSSFHLHKKCGEGSDGVVWKAIRRADAFVCAIKILKCTRKKASEGREDGVPKEANIMETLCTPGHTNIAKYYGWGVVYRELVAHSNREQYCCFPGNYGVFMVMEYVEGVTLERKISDITFGRNKRRLVVKQLLEAVNYMNSHNICHSSLFLDNIMLTKSDSASSICPRLVICDFGAASRVSMEETGAREQKLDKERRQCGSVLLSLFSSKNLATQPVTNKLMQKEALNLARDLFDVNQPLNLEKALHSPFLSAEISEDKFSGPISNLWNDEIMENIAGHLIRMGDVHDFAKVSLVCKQFYVVMQRQILCVPQFPNMQIPQSKSEYEIPLDSDIAECCFYFERLEWIEDWSCLADYSEGDIQFEMELLQSYFESISDHVTTVRAVVGNLSDTNQDWSNVILHFHDMRGSSSYIGNDVLRHLCGFSRDRAKILIERKPVGAELANEKNFYLRMAALVIENTFKFHKFSVLKVHKTGFELPDFII